MAKLTENLWKGFIFIVVVMALLFVSGLGAGIVRFIGQLAGQTGIFVMILAALVGLTILGALSQTKVVKGILR